MGPHDCFHETKISFFGRHFETVHFLMFFSFADLRLPLVYTGMVHVSYQNSYGKVLKNGWVQVDSPCAQMGMKSSWALKC